MDLSQLPSRFFKKFVRQQRNTLSREYFENIYKQREDPWNFETSDYEREKYSDTIAILPRQRYGHVLEIGCSIGVQTSLLADRSCQLTAIDISEIALERAKVRCSDLSNVNFARMTVPAEYPEQLFDLTVLSEVGYYFKAADLSNLCETITAHSYSKAHLLLVHWTLKTSDHPLSGDRVHELFLARPEWSALSSFKRDQYRVDLLELRE